MEHIKNDSLFTYIDSIETQDFLSNYKFKKFPKLNHYAEMYLENLEKEKLNKEINSNNDSKDNLNLNIDNINDITSSIKGLSNDVTNNDSIINTNFQLNKNKYTHQKNESSESNIFKTVNYLAIEQLKDNMRNKKKNTNIISKVNTLSIIQDNKNNDYNKLFQNQMTNNENKKKYFKKIIPITKNKLEARLFFNFNKSQPLKLEEKYKFSNSNKTQNNLYFRKSNNFFFDNKKTLLNNDNEVCLNKMKKYEQISPLFQILTTNRKKNKNMRTKLINSFTENSRCDSITTKNTINKIYSITLNDYWKEKEIKKRIKLAQLKQEKNLKELGQLREKPKINKNSIKIAERLGSNSSNSVFERLSESCNKILFNERKINLFTQTNKNSNKTNKIIKLTTNSLKVNKNSGVDLNYQTLKQSIKNETNNKPNNIRYNTINKTKKVENKIKKFQDKNKNDYNTEFRQKTKVQKIMYRNKIDLDKSKTNRINTKYINKYRNINNEFNKVNNKNENHNLLYDNNVNNCFNSTENLILSKNPINDKVKYLIKNKRLKDFLNKNKSSSKFKSEENTKRKINNKIKKQNEIFEQKNKNISQLINEEDLFEEKNNKEISDFRILFNDLNNSKNNLCKNNIEKSLNNLKEKNNNTNNKRNKQMKNNIIGINSFNGNINNNKTINCLNNSKKENNEENCKIKRRKMDLLKILNFSSNIRINKNK